MGGGGAYVDCSVSPTALLASGGHTILRDLHIRAFPKCQSVEMRAYGTQRSVDNMYVWILGSFSERTVYHRALLYPKEPVLQYIYVLLR